jgi:hypothetical protein
MEIFIATIMIVGIGVMFRVIRIQAALLLIVLVAIATALWPSAGRFSQNLPTWVFWGVVMVIAINLLKAILSVLFGR